MNHQPRILASIRSLLLVMILVAVSGRRNEVNLETWSAEDHWTAGQLNCTYGPREFNEHTQKRVYIIGVHAPSGNEAALHEFNMTFETYMNKVVGKRWDPPIEFQMKPSEDPLVSWIDNGEPVDFMYADTGIYSCIGTEIGSQALGTTIANLNTRGRIYDLDTYGGRFTLDAIYSRYRSAH
eukprot:scaffold9004_cov107-Cylindrotheca_fusiformis.AAC.2